MKTEEYLLIAAPGFSPDVTVEKLVVIDSNAFEENFEVLQELYPKWVNDPRLPISTSDVVLMQKRANNIERILNDAVHKSLNQIHHTNYSQRGTDILSGHWIKIFSDAITYRKFQIEKCIEIYGERGTYFTIDEQHVSPPKDTASSEWIFDENVNNIFIYGELIKMFAPGFKVSNLEGDFKEKVTDQSRLKYHPSISEKVKGKLSLWLEFLGSKFYRDTHALVMNTYLPFFKELSLNFSLGQLPRFPRLIQTSKSQPDDAALRFKFQSLLEESVLDSETRSILRIFVKFTPKCLLEDFQANRLLAENALLPKNPKFIFTSNSFKSDEIFKIWTSNHVDQGTPYYVGQHGNNYGVSKYLSPSVEERTSTRFLTWGLENGNSISLFVLKNPCPKQRRLVENRKKLLIIESCQAPHVFYWDTRAEQLRVVNDQGSLISNLRQNIKEQTVIRLHHQNWQDKDPFVQKLRPELGPAQFNFGNTNIKPLIEESRLVVHAYDSTGILETLSANIPTLAIWRNGIDHILPWARPFYESMFEAELFFNDPLLVAQKINNVWPEIDLWWQSMKIQTLRQEFCQHFARKSKRPIQDLLKILKSS